MVKYLFFFTMITSIASVSCYAQDNPRPTKSRFWKSKQSTFVPKAGDILVYQVDADGESFDFLVYIKQFGSSIKYQYDIPTKQQRSTVMLDASAIKERTRYPGRSGIDSTIFLWLSKKNYKEIAAAGSAMLDVGNGLQEFIKGNNGILKINYKGKSKILTLYNIAHKDTGAYNLGILTEEANPLVLTIDTGIRMRLKEVR